MKLCGHFKAPGILVNSRLGRGNVWPALCSGRFTSIVIAAGNRWAVSAREPIWTCKINLLSLPRNELRFAGLKAKKHKRLHNTQLFHARV